MRQNLAREQVAYQQALEGRRALANEPTADVDLVVEVDEDLVRAREWLFAAYNGDERA